MRGEAARAGDYEGCPGVCGRFPKGSPQAIIRIIQDFFGNTESTGPVLP